MAKKFDNVDVKIFDEVNKASAEKASVVTLINVSSDNLIDHSNNGESMDTVDLVTSMKDNGFTDPLEVTTFGMEDGKYLILSGRRRRAAGLEVGITAFPCVVRSFENKAAVDKYVLYANNHRDSSKDPLLLVRRYKLHEAQLREEGFKGSYRTIIAERMGLSPQQADRYEAMNSIIEPVWDMVADEIVGISSVHPMASHPVSEQAEILTVMKDYLATGGRLTRDAVKIIIDDYRASKLSIQAHHDLLPEDVEGSLPLPVELSGRDNTEDTFSSPDDNAVTDIGSIPDAHYNNGKPNKIGNDGIKEPVDINTHCEGNISADNADMDINSAIDMAVNATKGKKPRLSESEKQLNNGNNIIKWLETLDTFFNASNNVYTFELLEEAELCMSVMASVTFALIDEMYNSSKNYKKDDVFIQFIQEVKKRALDYLS